MGPIFLTTFAAGLLISGVSIFLMPPEVALSIVSGYGLMFLNMLLLTGIWKLVYRKKKVALFGTVVVIKSVILLGLVYLALKSPKIDPRWFFLGLSGYFLVIVVSSLIKTLLSKE